MAIYTGRLQGSTLEPTSVTVETIDNQLRIVTGQTEIGSWPLASVSVERTSIYRFALEIEDDTLEFIPDEPTGFSDEIGAVIDLTPRQERFGLKARLQEAKNS
jgi:hypothetical protein